jgi:hypothetical protein
MKPSAWAERQGISYGTAGSATGGDPCAASRWRQQPFVHQEGAPTVLLFRHRCSAGGCEEVGP